jgi:hypothetical protein
MDNSIRHNIVWFLDKIQDCVLYFRWYRPLKREKNPQKRLEKRLWIEIAGIGLGGMGSSGAYVMFKTDHYEKLSSEKEKAEVRKVLLSMLKSDKYTVSQKEAIAFVCSDLQVEGTEEDISLVREAAVRMMTMQQLADFKRKERLSQGKT